MDGTQPSNLITVLSREHSQDTLTKRRTINNKSSYIVKKTPPQPVSTSEDTSNDKGSHSNYSLTPSKKQSNRIAITPSSPYVSSSYSERDSSIQIIKRPEQETPPGQYCGLSSAGSDDNNDEIEQSVRLLCGFNIQGINSKKPSNSQPIKPILLPSHLEKALLNAAPISDDPSLLPLPHRVMLNHLYQCNLLEENQFPHKTLTLGLSTRYKNKFVTTVYYVPID